MNCLECNFKYCKTEGQDCNGLHDAMVERYQDIDTKTLYTHADQLVAGGRAGTLARLEEIAEFAKLQHYEMIGIAYCFGVENLAKKTAVYLKSQNLKVRSFRCSMNGLRENEISPELTSHVNCNPIGQAEAINRESIDFVIEMGLCLGHDVLFHQALKKPMSHFYFFCVVLVLNWIAFVGHASTQDAQAKQSGTMDFLFRIPFIALDGQAFTHASQWVQVFGLTRIRNSENCSTSHPIRPKGQKRWHQGR